MQKSQALAVYVLAASILLVGAFGLLTTQISIPVTGTIKVIGLGVYWDLQCTNITSSINFGQLEPGSSKNFTLYLKNEGNSALTLNMTLENWDPLNAANYMNLTWNREGQQINPNEIKDCVLTLSVSQNIPAFNYFGLVITLSGTS